MWWETEKKRKRVGKKGGKANLLRMRSSDTPDFFGTDVAVMSLVDVL